MTKATYRDRWVSEVFRTPLITDTTRVALLALVPEMDEEGRVSAPREWLCEKLGRSPRKIDERFKSAIDAGFLVRLSRGQKYRPARYQATLPECLSAPPVGRTEPVLSAPPVRRAENSQRADPQHPENDPPAKFSAPPVRRAEDAPLYKDRAHAHSKGDRRSTTATAEDDDSRPGGVVVALFNEEIAPSLRSNTADLRSAARVNPDRFDEFWTAYPRRVAKGAARKAWDKAIKNGADPQEIIWGAKRYTSDPRRTAADIRYTAHPATWLNSERWTDEDEAPPAAAVAPRQQATNDRYERAMQRAAAREENTR